ncbi:MAG: DUF3224 domain-containing protein [Steroidobacter sp.]
MSQHIQSAKGTFEVTITPQPYHEGVGDAAVGRMAIAKVFSGEMTGTGIGQMLAFRSSVQGSAGYVAMEKVQGTLNGRNGSFIMQHNGSMNRGEPQLSIKIVADSGADQLTGIAGEMLLNIEQGKHFYEFRYTLPE